MNKRNDHQTPFQQQIQHYQKANIENIIKAIDRSSVVRLQSDNRRFWNS